VLVVDDFSLKIVATLLHTDILRQHGVTLVLAIRKDREAITDAPVVYFVRATHDNASAMVKDLEGGLYKEVCSCLRVCIGTGTLLGRIRHYLSCAATGLCKGAGTH